MLKTITTPLSLEEQLDAASNYLETEDWDIPPWVIAPFIAEAAEEAMERFTAEPVVSPRIALLIERRIEEYRASEAEL